MNFSENAQKVLEKRYLSRDAQGNTIEDIEGLFWRVANHVAGADKNYKGADTKSTAKEFFELMTSQKFMPNSPTLMNAGKELGQLSACFVLPIEDTMEGIFDTLKNAALIHKSGGGTGFSFSRLRQAGATVASTGGVASGPVSFMKVFNAATEAVKQGGTRRGANMGILRVDHPDIMDFITCKRDLTELTNFNISVGINEEFVKAVIQDEEYNLIDPKTKEIKDTVKARKVFDTIVDLAWLNGEPGIIFLDRINRDNPVPGTGEIESTNPCGEQPLLPFESCNLGSINLAKFVVNSEIDFVELKKTIISAVHFLDNVIDVNCYPLQKIDESTKATRKIGLGVMGFADMLYMMNIAYNSDKAIATAEEVMKFIHEQAKIASSSLAQLRGNFPLHNESVYALHNVPMRNSTVTTIAPTGTISIICNASSGIEPVFALSYIRNVMDKNHLTEVHPYFEKYIKDAGLYSDELMRDIAASGSLHEIDLPDEIKQVFVTAHDILPEYHVRMQAAFQKYTDNAVSKTVNFPSSAKRDDIAEVYMLAYELGLKGVTIYRDQSRNSQVLNVGKVNDQEAIKQEDNAIRQEENNKEEQEKNGALKLVPRERPNTTFGLTEKVKIGCGNLYITVNFDDTGLCEVFANLGRAGGCPSQSEATSRLISTSLRAGVDVASIVEQVRGIRCHATLRKNGLHVLSCPDAIGRTVEKALKLWEQQQLISPDHVQVTPVASKKLKGACPECGGLTEHEGGCVVCRECGFSKCG